MITHEETAIAALADLLRQARRLMIFTGAGISTASGIPDFRGPQGVWRTRTPVFFDEFVRDPEARRRYWQQKLADRDELGGATPTAAHRAIADLEDAGKVLAVVTQNIDGLHQDAGSRRVIEVHGSARRITCLSCGAAADPDATFAEFAAVGEPPRCERCGGWLKPATISFGQPLDQAVLAAALAAADECDAVVALGSTLAVSPAQGIPLHAAERGVPYAIVNRGPTEHDRRPLVSLRIEGDVERIVPAAVRAALDSGPSADRADTSDR